jgi:hypothetical protein
VLHRECGHETASTALPRERALAPTELAAELGGHIGVARAERPGRVGGRLAASQALLGDS